MPMDSQCDKRYLELLSKDFPNRHSAFTEIINLQAILNLPKGTEHFISDVHGEFGAFNHILNNASGVIREKVKAIFPQMTREERSDFCTLIYYPKEILKRRHEQKLDSPEWYRHTVGQLVELANFLSSKYTRSKVRHSINASFSYIIDELMNARSDEDNNRARYHECILDSIIGTNSACDFIETLSALVKRLAVNHLHVLGDLFDRGSQADKVVDALMAYHSMDLQWGNHDVLWMGAACGSEVCQASVVRINVKYGNYRFLENGYGISLRKLAIFADKTYKDEPGMSAIFKAIAVISLKLQEQAIMRHKEYNMASRLLLSKIDFEKHTVTIDGVAYEMSTTDLPTIDPADPTRLTDEERDVVEDLRNNFLGSPLLQKHAAFLYHVGSMYKRCNGNLLYHGCVPMYPDGSFENILCKGKYLSGKAYYEYCDRRAREAWTQRTQDCLDFMWYLWCGEKSPLSGRVIKTFERTLIKDKKTWKEPKNPYYDYYYNEETCRRILEEFDMDPETGHIINGHTPIKVKDGESPIRANGKLLVIDGGFCVAYQKATGIAGYTLIYNSHNLRLKAHTAFSGLQSVLEKNEDMLSNVIPVETFTKRRMVADIDDGYKIRQSIAELSALLDAYEKGLIAEPEPLSVDLGITTGEAPKPTVDD